MKKKLMIFLLVSSMVYGANARDCKKAVENRGFNVTKEFRTPTDSGGEISRGFTATRNGSLYSVYVELDSNGNVLVFDVLKIS